MKSRREAIRILGRFVLALAGAFSLASQKVGKTFAEIKKRILPADTDPSMLSGDNPEYLDTRNLKIMPLERFGTMGDVDQVVNIQAWRLSVDGAVQRPLTLSYDELLEMPAIHKNVLLVCPGFFSYHAKWTGISIQGLMKRADVSGSAEKIIIRGQSKHGEKKEVFRLLEVKTDAVFLAYAVNDRKLPQKYGFPLRTVADGHWGAEWIKYVTRITFE